MAPAPALRRPVSTLHAFALASDLTLVRDPLHSMLVPFLLRGPWVLAGALLPAAAPGAGRSPLALLSTFVLLGGSISWWAVDAMLRVRARSVFHSPHGVPPAPARECYRAGLGRLGWLYATEFVRGVALTLGFSMFVLPGIYLGYKLAFSTEAVVLNDRNLFGAFEHSFHLSRGRFERWLEMVAISVFIALGVIFLGTVLSLVVIWLSFDAWKTITLMLLVLLWPIFQYAWTFFYLRLIEIEEPQAHAGGPFAGSSGLAGPWGRSSPPAPSSPAVTPTSSPPA